jgi:tRNA pseudouridine synthase 10
MLEKYALCDHCLGRQYALLGHKLNNAERGRALKIALTLDAHAQSTTSKTEAARRLRAVAANGFHEPAQLVLKTMKKPCSASPEKCFLCEDMFQYVNVLAGKALCLLENFEHNTFLVGIELPVEIVEREDEFKAEFEVNAGENMRNEFGRLIGKIIAEKDGKEVDFKRPEVVVLAKPFDGEVRLQVNSLFIAGRYKKLTRGIPQSKWYCSSCHGRGCDKCDGTGKMYAESVEEIIGKPTLEVTGGTKTSFHASGREDIDARMLGNGRPFVIEISKPKKRFINLDRLQEAINTSSKDRVNVSKLRIADKGTVRTLKKGESTQKEYRVTIQFADKITAKDLKTIKDELTNIVVHQKTPNRVLHRRADLMREKYIYEVNVKKLTPQKAEMKIRCQGGLYVKELVSGDGGRTSPSVTEILGNEAKPVKLDVLKIIMQD